MTSAADLVLTGGEVHTLASPDRTASAVAVRDGRVVRVGSDYEIRFLDGVETHSVDLDGRVLLPGFVDAHTHMLAVARYREHADLREAESLADCLDALRAADDGDWVLGFGFDESRWEEGALPTAADLDAVTRDRPVLAFREDMHTAVGNAAALDALGVSADDPGVRTAGGDPTGVLVEAAAGRAFAAVDPDADEARSLLETAQSVAHRRGVTGVHDVIDQATVAAAYRRLDDDDALRLRVRLNYTTVHLDAVEGAGLVTNHGSEFVRTGGVKVFVDGSIGSRTARLAAPYVDAPDEAAEGDDPDDGTGDDHGQWVTAPEELRTLAERVADDDRQLAAHAIGDEAIGAVLDALAAVDDSEGRHRVEHAELATDEQIARFADLGAVASMQPNFHKWAGEGGLYERRLGAERTRRSNRLADFRDAGVAVAFGSDCMPFDPLVGVHHAVNAPTAAQRLDVTAALRAYTLGSARAGFDEERLGTVETGKCGDFVALECSPWEHPDEIGDIDVALTVVDGEVVYDGRS